MDILTLSLAVKKALAELGAKREIKVITYDGNKVGSDLLGDGNLFVKISDEHTNLKNVISYTLVTSNGAQIVLDNPGVTEIEGAQLIILGTNSEGSARCHIMSIPFMEGEEDVAGLYVVDDPNFAYVSRITFETIHPIDQKFLPGVCLPVVELTTELVADTAVELSDVENATLTKAAEDKTPIIISFQLTAGETTANFSSIAPFIELEGIPSYSCTVFQQGVELYSEDAGKWTATLVFIN